MRFVNFSFSYYKDNLNQKKELSQNGKSKKILTNKQIQSST
jgi:hypothetical protein